MISANIRCLLGLSALAVAACGEEARTVDENAASAKAQEGEAVASSDAFAQASQSDAEPGTIHPDTWPTVNTPPLDPEVEARVDEILAQLTLEQKVGQVIQADSGSVTPEDVKRYRLGSVLSGGNSAPGGQPYAATDAWVAAADAYWAASVDPEGVEVAVPVIWGIDAVHGHNNLTGAVVFPHNIGLGAANDPDLIERIMTVTARELSVSGHDWTFAPTLAVPRDDRWGRTYEGFSEDPAIVAAYAPAVVRGLQGEAGTDGFMGEGRVITSAKHFVGDGGTQGGTDQGDAVITEAELRDIHAPGYVTALEAGAQTVMASFSAWQGQRMHGQEALLTDVLKGRMNFQGFVIGDWNGHALIPGCTATDCPQSLNAGLDMYMAPDSWRGLWESTLAHVQDGTIPMDRLDDAVRRILRVKIASGVMDDVRPSERPLSGRTDLLASGEHRAVAREAVRRSLVLLKNQNGVLPLDAGARVLVTGDGADSITKQAGGWTLSWQGGGYPNEAFPNGQSILSGIQEAVAAGGGTTAFALEPTQADLQNADVVIAVYGEDPYAEFQGDREDVDFAPNGFDTARLAQFREAGAKVVSVFLSGRPLFVNPELNGSDAFVAAFLPGTEGGGVADLLFRTEPDFDFTGRLSYSWPRAADQTPLNAGDEDYDPLFALGYGLSYDDDGNLDALPEASRADGPAPQKGVFFERGQARAPYALADGRAPLPALPARQGGISVAATDKDAQEDALRIAFEEDGAVFAITGSYGQDFSRETVAAMELTFDARVIEGPGDVRVGVGCGPDAAACFVPVELPEDWRTVRLALSCFAREGANMADLRRALVVEGAAGQVIGLANVRLQPDDDGAANCQG